MKPTIWALACYLLITPSSRADDARGDTLPPGAVLRLGSLRWRATGAITLTAFRQDGRELLTVGQDRGALIWDLETGRELRRFDASRSELDPTIDRNEATLGRIAVSGDGKTLAAVDRDRTLRVWDVDTGKELRSLGAYPENHHLALSPDGKKLALADQTGQLRIWDVTATKPVAVSVATGAQGRSYTYRLEFGPDGKTLLQVGMTYSPNGGVVPGVVVWDAVKGTELKRTSALPEGAGNNAVLRAFPASDHKTLFVPLHNSIAIMDLAEGKELRRLKDVDQSDYSTFLPTPNGKELVQVIGRNEAFVVWDLAKGEATRRFGKVNDAMVNRYTQSGHSISADGKTLAYGDGALVTLLDLQTGKTRGGNEGHSTSLLGAYYSPDGKTILTRANRSYVRWDAATGQFVERFDVPGEHTTFLLSRDVKWMVATGPNMTLHMYELPALKEKHSISLQVQGGYTYTVAPDSKTLIVLGRPAAALQVFDLTTGHRTAELPLPPLDPDREDYAGSMPRRLTTTRDARFVAGSTESTIIVWDLAWLREVQRIPIPQGRILRHVTFGPDNRTLAVEFYGGEIGIWEVASGTRRRLLTAGQKESRDFTNATTREQLDGSRLPAALSYSFDGRFVANAGVDRKIRIWDARSGREIGSFEGHRGAITGVGFAPDTARLVTACADTSALVWDLNPLRAKLTPLPTAGGENLWAALNDADGEKAYAAILALGGDAAKSVPLLRGQLKAIAPPDEKAMAKVLADLDAGKYATRLKARQELERLGDLAVPALKQAMESSASAEVRVQARRLLERLSLRQLTPEQVRHIRAVEALELAGTAEAKALLKELAAGAQAAPLTIEATAALDRMK